MRAFHSMWTGPFLQSYEGDFYIEDFELLTTILSALKWQACNGEIKMITDAIGAAYYRKLGLEKLWDLGIEEGLTEIDSGIDPRVFWAAGKLYALAQEEAPCVMLDTDFIVWQNVEQELKSQSVMVIHEEELNPQVYPPQSCFQMHSEYEFPAYLDWTVKPCNTAFMYINDQAFKTFYVEEAKRFIRAAKGEDPLTYMVFAEQRLLGMCAKAKDKEIGIFAEVSELFNEKQRCFTHVWGHKRYLRSHPEARIAFCRRCMRRIKEDFPQFYQIVLEIEALSPYAQE